MYVKGGGGNTSLFSSSRAPSTQFFTLQADTSILTLNEGGVGIFGRFSAFGMKNFGFSVLLSVVVSGFSLF